MVINSLRRHTIPNRCVPSHRTSKYTNQTLTETEGGVNQFTVVLTTASPCLRTGWNKKSISSVTGDGVTAASPTGKGVIKHPLPPAPAQH